MSFGEASRECHKRVTEWNGQSDWENDFEGNINDVLKRGEVTVT